MRPPGWTLSYLEYPGVEVYKGGHWKQPGEQQTRPVDIIPAGEVFCLSLFIVLFLA